MKELFFSGGPLIMSILSLLLIVMVFWILYQILNILYSPEINRETSLRKIALGKIIGLTAMITGILHQLIGFFHAFSAIQKAGDISPSLLYAGIKISLISTMYGVSIYLLSIILWFGASMIIEKRK